VSFDVTAAAYGRFMGRFSEPLSTLFADWADVRPGHRVLDVGCGPGALTATLVERLGADAVSAVDPSEPFVAATRSRFPMVDVRSAGAEQLPFPDGGFDAALAQLVVHFMTDPVAGVREMARVTRAGGVVAACVWDHAGDRGPLSTFWRAVRNLDPDAPDESGLPGAHEGHLSELFEQADVRDVRSATVAVKVGFATFGEWWEPYTLGVGPAGAYASGLDERGREALRMHCAELLPDPPFELEALAWTVRGHA
jgi:SAM-dependent methyltransferase